MNDQMILSPYYLDEARPAFTSLAGDNWRVLDSGLPPGEVINRMGHQVGRVADTVANALEEGLRPVLLAGDCCATIGMIAGLQRAGRSPTLLWFDAHGDFNTWETSPSGFLGGMPLAMAVGRGEQTLLDASGCRPVAESDTVLCDGRDLDPGERTALEDSLVHHIADFNALVDESTLPAGPLYVHFDSDIIDPSEAPAMNYPAPNGPTAAAVSRLFGQLAATGRVEAVSVSLWEPSLDGEGVTEAAVIGCLAGLLG